MQIQIYKNNRIKKIKKVIFLSNLRIFQIVKMMRMFKDLIKKIQMKNKAKQMQLKIKKALIRSKK